MTGQNYNDDPNLPGTAVQTLATATLSVVRSTIKTTIATVCKRERIGRSGACKRDGMDPRTGRATSAARDLLMWKVNGSTGLERLVIWIRRLW